MVDSPTAKFLADDLEKESLKVRSMYETGSALDWRDGKYAAIGNRFEIEEETLVEESIT